MEALQYYYNEQFFIMNNGTASCQTCLFLSQQCFSWQDADSAISISVKGRHELK